MKKKVLLSSIMTIALCLSLIAGSTFALFTHSIELGIEATAGNVEIEANIENLTLWSVTPDVNGDVIDENKAHYVYEDQTAKDKFLNTGTAKFENNSLEIKKITPGDKVKFDIVGKNTGNIPALMRYVVELNTDDAAFTNKLAEGMVFLADGINYTGVTSYTSVWVPVAEGADMPSVTVELGLPVYAGNDYENANVKYNVRVEAVQGNAANEYDRPIVEVANAISDQAEFEAAMADPFLETVLFDADAAVEFSGEVSNKTIHANGNAVSFTVKSGAKLDDITIIGLKGDYAAAAVSFESNISGELTIKDCQINTASGKEAVLGKGNDELVLNVEDCTFNNGKYGIRTTGNLKSLDIKNTTFEGKSGWAIMLNGTVLDTVSINNCEFINCADGLAKAGVAGGTYSGAVEQNFDFVGNTITNCFGHDYGKYLGTAKEQGPEVNILAIKYLTSSTVTISGNVKDGAAWTPGAAQGIVQK